MGDVATEKSWDTTTIRKSLKFCLKTAWFINDTLNLNAGLLIVGDHATHKATLTIVFLTTGMSGRCDAIVNSGNSSSTVYPPVLKFDDRDPGSSNKPHQDDNNNNIINGGNTGNDDVPFKIPNNNQNIINGENENGGNNNDDNEIRDGNPNNNNRVGSRILVREVYANGIIKRPDIRTNINLIEFNNWNELSVAVLNIVRRHVKHDPRVVQVMGFSGFDESGVMRYYRSFETSWDNVKTHLKDIFLFRGMYDPHPNLRDMPIEEDEVEFGVTRQMRHVGPILDLMEWFEPIQVIENVEFGGGYNGGGYGDDNNGSGNIREGSPILLFICCSIIASSFGLALEMRLNAN